MEKKIKNEIKENLERSIRNFFEGKKVTSTHVLDSIFPVERRIRSLIGGLETSLGTTVWEPIAETLAKNNGFKIKDTRSFRAVANEPDEIMSLRNKWIRKRQNGDGTVSLNDFKSELINLINEIEMPELELVPLDSGDNLDVWIEKNGTEYAIDIKTTQPNANAGNSFNDKLIRWYTFRFLQDPKANFQASFGFPFNPYSGSFWQKAGGRLFPLVLDEDAFVENNFWSKLSGEEKTWEHIDEIFQELGEENFGQEFHDLFYKSDQ